MHQAFNFATWKANDAAPGDRVIDRLTAANDAVERPTPGCCPITMWCGMPATRPARRAAANGIRAMTRSPTTCSGFPARAATLLMLALPGSAYLYQGEELGLPDHTALDDGLRQDPTWWRSGYTEAGRDGCRVPLPWEAESPGLGFGPGGSTWLPQPPEYAELARDRQVDVDGSTLEMYRTALVFRRAFALSVGSLTWVDGGPGVLRFTNGELTVAANTGSTPVPMPDGELLMASADLARDGMLPPDVTVWLLTEAFSE